VLAHQWVGESNSGTLVGVRLRPLVASGWPSGRGAGVIVQVGFAVLAISQYPSPRHCRESPGFGADVDSGAGNAAGGALIAESASANRGWSWAGRPWARSREVWSLPIIATVDLPVPHPESGDANLMSRNS
jgi:hypothetical protein